MSAYFLYFAFESQAGHSCAHARFGPTLDPALRDWLPARSHDSASKQRKNMELPALLMGVTTVAPSLNPGGAPYRFP